MGICRAEDRWPASERGSALLQPRAQACEARGVDAEASGLLPGDLPNGNAAQPRGGCRALPVRYVVLVLQFPLLQSGTGLRSGVLLAGSAQGQDIEVVDGSQCSVCRGSRRVEPRRQ